MIINQLRLVLPHLHLQVLWFYEPATRCNTETSSHRENEVEEVKEEGPKEMTLDEWKAIQNKDRAKVEFNIRKPNEGADGQWKKGFVLHKSKSEEVKWSFVVFENVQICLELHIQFLFYNFTWVICL